jgi:cold-inducible RNA-binding protein
MGNRLYVGNLSFDSDQDRLMQAFSAIGDVSEVHVVMDRETGRSRGFGFVTMGSASLAAQAISRMNGTVLDGRELRVNEAEERVARGGRR